MNKTKTETNEKGHILGYSSGYFVLKFGHFDEELTQKIKTFPSWLRRFDKDKKCLLIKDSDPYGVFELVQICKENGVVFTVSSTHFAKKIALKFAKNFELSSAISTNFMHPLLPKNLFLHQIPAVKYILLL